MSKVKRITVQNLKAVVNQTADFNGCTAIITGGNNKGKTSFLRSEMSRLRGIKPELILRQGESEGFSEIELTTGEKIKWEFNDKGKGFKEKMTLTTDKDIKTAVTTAIRDKYFPATFDVDAFLAAQPKQQRISLQKLVGLDFTAVDATYKAAYDDRENKNREATRERTVLSSMTGPAKVEAVDISELSKKREAEKDNIAKKYRYNQETNATKRKEWNESNDKLREEIKEWNELQTSKKLKYDACNSAYETLRNNGYQDLSEDLGSFMFRLKQSVEDEKIFEPLVEPEYIPELPAETELKRIDAEMLSAVEANQKASDYINYEAQKKRSSDADAAANLADIAVKAAETARMDLIKSAQMPEGFGFSEDGITYNDLPFTREQLSSSGIYIAALKLAAMTLGEVRTLHFDASFLDKNSLSDIEAWANSQDLQLLIERPDFEGGEIEYQLLCNA